MKAETHRKEAKVTTIRASCPTCGDVQLQPSDLLVRVCADDNQGSYCFSCPDCGFGVAKEASPRIVELLVSTGVRMDVWRLPAELHESKSGPTLSHDDLLDFHLLLQEDDWFESLVATADGADAERRPTSRG